MKETRDLYISLKKLLMSEQVYLSGDFVGTQ
jgi:hypothetical protein